MILQILSILLGLGFTILFFYGIREIIRGLDSPVEYARRHRDKAGYTLKGKEIKKYWVYGSDICPENDYRNHVKGDTCCLFGYCANSFEPSSIKALYHCKYCQTVMHFPIDKNPDEKELYEKRKIQTKNFRKPIKYERSIY